MKIMTKFVNNFLSVVYGFSSLFDSETGAVKKVKEQRSPELVADLKARAALKRERKAKKRVADNFHCIRHNYAGHATNYLV